MTNLATQHAPRGSSLWDWASDRIVDGHYLHKMPDPRTSFEVFIACDGLLPIGALVFGRPEATRCADWYGSVDDVQQGLCEVTRWQVLNLARVWIDPAYQHDGEKYPLTPGYFDRRGDWRSTLASSMIHLAVQGIGYEYLMQRPPVYLDEPYQIEWLLSYCDTSKHRGTIYRASGFELYRTNERGIQTWRVRLPRLTSAQHATIREQSQADDRAKRYRAQRAQLPLLEVA